MWDHTESPAPSVWAHPGHPRKQYTSVPEGRGTVFSNNRKGFPIITGSAVPDTVWEDGPVGKSDWETVWPEDNWEGHVEIQPHLSALAAWASFFSSLRNGRLFCYQ